MDSKRTVLSRISKTIAVLYWGSGQEIVFQLLSAFVWILSWGVDVYAEWLFLILVPMFVERGNVGIYHSATSALIGMRNRGDTVEAKGLFKSLLVGQWFFFVIVLVAYLSIYFLLNRFSSLAYFDPVDVSVIALLFIIQFYVHQSQQSILCLVKADGRAAYALTWYNYFRLAFIVPVLACAYLLGPVGCLCVAVVCQCSVVLATSRKFSQLVREYNDAGEKVDIAMTVRLLKHGIRYSIFPFGQSAVHTFSVWMIGIVSTPLLGAAFHNMRTITRSVVILVNGVEQATRIEYSSLFAEGNTQFIRNLLRRAVILSIFASAALGALLLSFGEKLFVLITRSELAYDSHVFMVLFLGSCFIALSSVYMAIMYSLNEHKKSSQKLMIVFIGEVLFVIPASYLGEIYVSIILAVGSLIIFFVARNEAMNVMSSREMSRTNSYRHI